MIFRNPAEVNFRAVRDVGLAAWFGSSLMGLSVFVPGVKKVIDDPVQAARVADAGWRASRGLTAGAVTAYVVGTSLVHFEGKPFSSKGVPRWMTEGPESPLRAALTGGALFTALTARSVRRMGDKLVQEQAQNPEARKKGQQLDLIGHALLSAVPAMTGALLYNHLKHDMRQTSGRRR